MTIRFDERVAIVTGSGRGLGAAYARLLAERGAAVVVHDAGVRQDGTGGDASVADGVVEGIRAAGGTAAASYENLDSRDACRRVVDTAVESFGRLDVLVQNAGLVVFAPVEEVDGATFDRVMDVSVAAPFWLAQAAFAHMKARRYGRIVLTTSGRAMFLESAKPGLTAYATGKMAQVGLMNALAAEGAEWGIGVNAISPVAATRVLRRPVEPGTFRPDQVAPAVAFLASDRCDVSGKIVEAGDGDFAVVGYLEGDEVGFGLGEITPEDVAAWWQGTRP